MLTHFHPILPISYYENAVQFFPSTVKFFIFCEAEDLEHVQKEFAKSTILSPRIFGYINTKIPDYIQLLMMAECSGGGIIANSTFSCWAAHLQKLMIEKNNAEQQKKKEPIIVAPDLWFHGEPAPDILDPSWKKASSSETKSIQKKDDLGS